MRVVIHPADRGGCGWYRLTAPGEALAKQGHDVTVAYDHEYRCVWQPGVLGDRVIGFAEPIDADVVVIQRPLSRNRVELISALQAEGVAVVVEVDDDFHAIHPRNPAWGQVNPLGNPHYNRDWLKRACDRADMVTVSTPQLAERYGSHGRVAVIRNRVPEAYTKLPLRHDPQSVRKLVADPSDPEETLIVPHTLKRPKGLLVGWSGSVITHPNDLPVLGDSIAEACQSTGAGFFACGTGYGVEPVLGVHMAGSSQWLALDDYPKALALLDVGLVPLALTEFNEAKSALKGLEMASVGTPFVASGTKEYRRLAEQGIGFIADSPGEWKWQVENLLSDPVMREECSIQWREEITRNHTIEGHAHEWWEAWEAAREFAQERRAA